jgi:hypothetical protein
VGSRVSVRLEGEPHILPTAPSEEGVRG